MPLPSPSASPAPGRRVRRLVLAAAVVAVVLSCGTGVASADEARPTNFESVIDDVTPEPATLDVQIVGGDAFVEVSVTPGTEVEVPGYDGEPYLRIDPDGTVLRNRRSSATYLNTSRDSSDAPLPDRVDPSAEPDWEPIGDHGVIAWHDHRIHWMLDTAPAAASGVVQEWELPLTVDGEPVEVEGRLLLRGDRFPWPALVGLAIAGLLAWRVRSEMSRALWLVAASTVALVSSLAWYLANPPGTGPGVLPLVLPALAVLAALGAAVDAEMVRRRQTRAALPHLLLPLAAVALLAGWFIQRLGIIWMPTLPVDWPDPFERVLGTSVVGVALGIAIAVVTHPAPSAVAWPSADQDRSSSSAPASQSSIPPRS